MAFPVFKIPTGIIFAVAILAGAATPGVRATELVAIEKQKVDWIKSAERPGLRVIVERPMTVKLGGLVGRMSGPRTLEEGVYKDLMQVRVAGRDVVLLPGKRESAGTQGRRSTGNVGACYRADGEFLLLDVETGEVLNQLMLRNRVMDKCGGGVVLDWLYSVSSISDPGKFEIAWGQHLVEADARAVESRREEFAAGQRAAQMASKLAKDSTRAAKRQIGAALCQWQDGVQYVGYTEGVSPDNGKVQIRIAEARVGGSRTLRPGGFTPTITWDNPDNWTLCE